MFKPNQINPTQLKKLVGKQITAITKSGEVLSGKLVQIKGNQIIIHPAGRGKVRTKALIPLALLAGAGAFGFGYPGYGYGYGYPGYYGYPFFF